MNAIGSLGLYRVTWTIAGGMVSLVVSTKKIHVASAKQMIPTISRSFFTWPSNQEVQVTVSVTCQVHYTRLLLFSELLGLNPLHKSELPKVTSQLLKKCNANEKGLGDI